MNWYPRLSNKLDRQVSSGGGGGGLSTASNALTAVGTNVKLGGTLVENTNINGAFNLIVGNATPVLNFRVTGSTDISLAHFSAGNDNNLNITPNLASLTYYNNTTNAFSKVTNDDTNALLYWEDGSTLRSFISLNQDGLRFTTQYAANNFAILKNNLLTAQRTFDYPNASGTLALISSVPSLPTVATTLTANSTLTYTGLLEQTQRGNTSGGIFTTILPTAVGKTGYKIIVKKIGSGVNPWTIDANGTETIDGSLIVTITVENTSLTLQSDGANWILI